MKKVLLHTCCGPCFTGSYDILKSNYAVISFWYNPNIEPEAEHQKRLETLRSYLELNQIPLISEYDYKNENRKWRQFIAGLEDEPEGGKRCYRCFLFRLKEASRLAEKLNLPFTTTLSISPYKNSEHVTQAAVEAAGNKAFFIQEDFKKKNGYHRSTIISKKYNLYRQRYCGCRFSLNAKSS